MNRIYLIIGLILLTGACEKSTIEKEPENLSEIIYGKWEWRESIDVLWSRDLEYIENGYYPEMYFFEDGTFITLDETDTVENGNFMVKEDSLLTSSNAFYIFGFSSDTLDLRYSGRHGPLGRKLFKVE